MPGLAVAQAFGVLRSYSQGNMEGLVDISETATYSEIGYYLI